MFSSLALVSAGCGSQSGGASGSTNSGTSAKADVSAQQVTITDHWHREVKVKQNPEKVVVLEWEGLVAKSMHLLHVDDRLVGVDSSTKKQPFRNAVIPGVKNAKDVGSPWSGVNYESVAALRPDVVFLEAWVASDENKKMHEEVVNRLENLGIPVIVMLSPSNFDQPNLKTAWEHIGFVGELFGRKDETDKIVNRMEREVSEVQVRVAKHTGDAPEAVIFASTAYVMGQKSIQSYMLTDILKAKNPVKEGTFVEISEEKLLSYNIPKLIVIGHEGYISPDDIFGGKTAGINWSKVASMPAIQTKNVVTLGYDEWRATLETPIALKKMGKLLYPQEFADVDVAADEVAFYQDIYGLNADAAKSAIRDQQFRGEL